MLMCDSEFPLLKDFSKTENPCCRWRECWRAVFSSLMQLWTLDKLSFKTDSLRVLRAVLNSRWFARFCWWKRFVCLFFIIPVLSEDSTSSATRSSTLRALKKIQSNQNCHNTPNINCLRLDSFKKWKSNSCQLVCPVMLRLANVCCCWCCWPVLEENLRLWLKDAWDNPCTFYLVTPPVWKWLVVLYWISCQ